MGKGKKLDFKIQHNTIQQIGILNKTILYFDYEAWYF